MPIPGTIVAPVQAVILPQGFPGTGPPAAPTGTGWEVQVWDHTFSQVIAYIPSWMSLNFSQIGNDKGSGTIQLPIDSPVFGPNPLSGTIMTDEVMFRVLQNGVPRFDFLAETVTETEADSTEQRTVTITGNGTAQTLAWGMSMPTGWPVVRTSKAAGIIEQFSTLDPSGLTYVLDTSIWNAVTPGAVSIPQAGTCYVTLAPGGAYLGGGPFDMTGSSFSVSLPVATPIVTTNTTDGSEVIQFIVSSASGPSGGYAMIALSFQEFYAQFTDAEGNSQQKIFAPGEVGSTVTGALVYDTSWAQFWRISCDVNSSGTQTWRFWASGDGTTWTVYWSVSPNHPFNASTCNIYMGGIYDTPGFARTQVSSINGEITNPPSSGPVFLTQPLMASYLQLLAACKARGTIPWIAPAFSGQVDSAQKAWTDSWSIQVPNGTDLYTLLQEYTGALGGDFIMQPGFVLQVGRQGSLGIDRSHQIIFPDGQVTQKGRTQDRTTIANLVAAQDADGQMRTATDAGSVIKWGQREKLSASGGVIDAVSAESLAVATLDQAAQQVDQRILQIPPNVPGRTVWQDFAVFDWVGVERADFSAVDANQVIGITVSIDQDGGETHELVLQTYRQWIIAQLQYLINKFGGQSISTLGALPPNAVTSLSPLAGITAALATQQTSSVSPSSSTVSQMPTTGVPGSAIQLGSIGQEQLSFTLASGVNVTFSPTAPANPNIGDLWYNTASGNQLATWTGTAWSVQQFGVPAVSFAATDIGGITTYVQGTAPSGAATGSLWFDSSNGFKLNQWNGSSWQPYQWGTNSIGSGAVGTSNIAANAITAALIAANTITAAQIAANTITAAQIAAGTITATQIAANTITAAKIAANTITAAQIAANTITAGQLAAGIVYAGIVDATTITGASVIADGSSGEILVYNGTPALGNLIGSWSGAGGTDTPGNTFHTGLEVELGGLILDNQSSSPGGTSGASTFYSSIAGRPRYISQVGDDSVLERSVINTGTYSSGNTTTPTAVSASTTYRAGEGAQSSEIEIEIDGTITTGTSFGNTVSFQLAVDGTVVGPHLTGGAIFFPLGALTFFYVLRVRLTIVTTGAPGTASVTFDGAFGKSANFGSESSFPVINAGVAQTGASGGLSFDTTSSHTLQVFAWWGGAANPQQISTTRTKITRRM
jgi:hypothetical protein